MRSALLAAFAAASVALALSAAGAETKPANNDQALFTPIYSVLESPRCRNCHPAGDAPLQFDAGTPHAMSVRRGLEEVGMSCETCHAQSAVAPWLAHQPPAVPGWNLPPKETPMVFEGKTPAALCEQLKDPARNGRRSLDALLLHVAHDDLVLWAWNPGPGRTPPPMTHDAFVAAFKAWTDAGAPCPQS